MKWFWLGLLVSTAALAGRPLTVDDAGPVAPRKFELEAGVVFVRDNCCNHFDFPLGLAAGIVPTLEAGIGFGGQVDERLEEGNKRCTKSGIGDFIFSAKWNPLAADRFWADHALALTVKVPTADTDKELGSGVMDFDLMYIATKNLGERFNADFNLGYTWVGGDNDVLHYGLALRWQALEKWELVGEAFADMPFTVENDTSVVVNAGVRWVAVDGVTVDVAGGAGLRGDAPDWTVTVGVTWAFGFNKEK